MRKTILIHYPQVLKAKIYKSFCPEIYVNCRFFLDGRDRGQHIMPVIRNDAAGNQVKKRQEKGADYIRKKCSKTAALVKITHIFLKSPTRKATREKSDEKDGYPVFCIQKFYDDRDVT